VGARPRVDTSEATGKTGAQGERHATRGDIAVANHLTPTELADEVKMKRQEVIAKCMELGVPIFHGRIDKTLFLSSLRSAEQEQHKRAA
jgi:hypothetical protein